MNIDSTLKSLGQIAGFSERYFNGLKNSFAAIPDKKSGNTVQNMLTVLEKLKKRNQKSSDAVRSVFDGYEEKYTSLFDDLNRELEALSELDKFIAEVKEDSEQMELIALNAMVISIQSGDKGLAFSRITENLQRLSKNMFLLSDKLLDEEKFLIDHINELKGIFVNMLNAQKVLSNDGVSAGETVSEFILSMSEALKSVDTAADDVYGLVQDAAENLRWQDAVGKSFNRMKDCLSEMRDISMFNAGGNAELDALALDITLVESAVAFTDGISANLAECLADFENCWSGAASKLSRVDLLKKDFEVRFVDDGDSAENIEVRFQKMIQQLRDLTNQFNRHQIVQKDLYHVMQNITEKSRAMYTVFGNIRPVMRHLHHVRILQQIEVSKNDVIKSVTDSVLDMDNLINSANAALDNMEELLSNFVKETGALLSRFKNFLEEDSAEMISLRKEKSAFLDILDQSHEDLSSAAVRFQVIPAGLENKCDSLARNFAEIENLNLELKNFRRELSSVLDELRARQKKSFETKGVSQWNVTDPQFRDLMQKFSAAAAVGAEKQADVR